MSTSVPAQVFPPGEFIKEEMEARGWTQDELAAVMGRPRRLVNEILAGVRAITPETAHDLGEAFGTGPEVWMNLESAYRLSLVQRDKGEVTRRSKLYSLAPVKDMVKRNWIEPSDSVDDLDRRLKSFFGVPTLDQEPELSFAARKSSTYGISTPEQRAWAFRVKELGRAVVAAAFIQKFFEERLAALRNLIAHEADVRRVPQALSEMGVRFVVVEPLPKSRMDGLTLWLDEKKPVVAVSGRYDRIDHFWFTLLHELIHVKHGDAISIDENLVGDEHTPTSEKPESEVRADREAAEFLVPAKDLESFIVRVGPLYSRAKVMQFANRIRVHPGIIVGQLQRRGELKYSQFRDTLAKVREPLARSALTDGWGASPPLRK
jgi:HTH-type transcriptional regulator/antitoxin HigA